jgi:thioredoxin 1
MELEITDKNFNTIISNSSKPVVIDFSAAWCGPCKGVSAAIETMANEYEEVLIGKVDVDVNPGLTSKFGVRNMPTVLYLKNGEVLDKQVGATTKMVLEEKLKAIL